jgi:glutamate synthase (NADPH/NADH) large chain
VSGAVEHWKARGLDLSPILDMPDLDPEEARRCITSQDHGLDRALDRRLIADCSPALEDVRPVRLSYPIRNVNRTVGTLLGAEISRRYGGEGLPDGTIDLSFTGSAGQSFGAFVPRGVTLRLEGDANDYLGKGLSGGRIAVRPSPAVPPSFVAEEHIIAGNVILYGATSGEVYLRGVVGERFCVRNSGALAVVEGVGDHGCEYMTGGRVVVLGRTGRNFGAGMSGGIAYVWDSDGTFGANLNGEMVDLEDCDESDVEWLGGVLSDHVGYTESAVGQRLLSAWPRVADSFVKVMPRDYKRVLKAMREAERSGRPVEEAVMAAAHG